MSAWVLAALAGVLAAALSYAGPRAGAHAVLAALRAGAVALLAALALGAPSGRSTPVPPLVALDASASWTRGGDASAFERAVGRARALSPDTLWLVGDSLRVAVAPVAADASSRLADAVERATAQGRPAVIVSDGEADDADALRRLPGGSRALVVAPTRGPDAGLTDLQAPRAASSADTLDVRVAVVADAAGSPAGSVALDANGRALGSAPLPALAAHGEHVATVRAPVGGLAGAVILRAVVRASGDAEPRNDTLAVVLDVTETATAVLVSTAPGPDARAVLAALRGTLGASARGYYEVTRGAWRSDATLAPVGEDAVRRALRDASVVVLHGDTVRFGAPRSATPAAVALVPVGTSAAGEGEWFATGAPPSPIAAGLSAVAWDSLPPIDAIGAPPRGEWMGLELRAGRRGPPRAGVAGTESGRRSATVAVAGTWRWQFRGGAAGDAFTALWGGVFDWLAAGGADRRAAVVADAIVRAGDPIRWRRAGTDSVVRVTLRRRGADSAAVDSLALRFGTDGRATAPPLRAGTWDVRTPGGASVLVVNAARELLPRRAAVREGPVGTGAVASRAPRLRDSWWPYVAAVLLLCAEWLLRRRAGLR